MHPFVVLSHSHSALTPFNAFGVGHARQERGALGKPVWGPGQLLRDLELRLGLNANTGPVSDAARILRWCVRLRELATTKRFYSASFAVDPLGTTQRVLALRDALKACAWDGAPIPNGGARLEALAELESLTHLPVPPNESDRALTVAAELRSRTMPLYAALTLGDVEAAWPACWRQVFDELKRCGTPLHVLSPLGSQASPATDLGKIQSALGEDSSSKRPVHLAGDGSFVRVLAETSIEAAQATAALLAAFDDPNTVVIREREVAVLDHALAQHGLPSQGLYSSSPWRAALQVLPLALELAFEPKDPQRILELLNLSRGPFSGPVARYFTRALQRAPGVGGQPWLEAKARILERIDDATTGDANPRDQLTQQLALVEAWFETRGANALAGASKDALLAVADRVRAWLLDQLSQRPLDTILRVGVQHCDDLLAALALEHQGAIDLVHVRRLCEFVINGGAEFELIPEQLGRMTSTGSARALYAPVSSVVWWMFTHDHEQPLSSPWRAQERAALAAAHIECPDLELQLAQRAAAYRRAVSAAQGRLILVSPSTACGQACASHPLWDELVAKVPLDAVAQAAVTCSADELLQHRSHGVTVPLLSVAPLALPVAHPQWNVNPGSTALSIRHSASSLSSLLGCPLQWALTYLAGLKSEEQALTSEHLLAGSLGHRLLEILHQAELFTADAGAFRTRANEELDRLIEREGAVLLRPGKAHELSQRSRQLVNAACTLRDLFAARGLSIRSVEASFEVPWREGHLFGRWDILAESRDGQQLLIDVKWGNTTYRNLLKDGNALQLATYGQALATQATAASRAPQDSQIVAAYYSLSSSKLFGVSPNVEGVELVPGDSLRNTWQRANRTLPLIEAQVSRGQLHVSGVSRATTLLTALNVPESAWDKHYETDANAACRYCAYDSLCGRRWEALQ